MVLIFSTPLFLIGWVVVRDFVVIAVVIIESTKWQTVEWS